MHPVGIRAKKPIFFNAEPPLVLNDILRHVALAVNRDAGTMTFSPPEACIAAA